ncbi:MAG: GAF domain-containing sensor histidine kinase [Chloroflexota bacterium]
MIVPSMAAAGYAALLGLALARSKRGVVDTWLIAFYFYSVLLMAAHALVLSGMIVFPPPFTGQLVVTIGLIISTSLVGFLTLSHLRWERPLITAWALLSVAWLAATLTTEFLRVPPMLRSEVWSLLKIGEQATLGAQLFGLGWLILSTMMFVFTWQTFLSEPLPLRANRILFWGVVLPLLVVGDVLSVWLNPPWNYFGYVIRLLGASGAIYAISVHRVPVLQDIMRWVVSRSIWTMVSAALILGGVLLVLYLQLPPPFNIQPWALGLVAALLIAILLQPINRLVSWLMRSLLMRGMTEPAEAARLYSRRISGVIELPELAEVAIQTIHEQLGTRRGRLLVATQYEERVALEVVGGSPLEFAGLPFISHESPVYKAFISDQQPILQYDLEFQPDFAETPEAELHYFKSLEMDIYAPIVGEETLVGMLAIGPKRNDEPFRPSEIELLAALAQQTVVALNNARLVSNLRTLNQEISALNEDLANTNNRLQRLDSVKSDFLLIASHELRTPLAQIQGYSDLLGEMSERKMLDPKQTSEITKFLSGASQRMTEVITSLLDVSQIDVQSLDLNFLEISLSAVLKMAIEPFADAIHQRDQTLVARGLRNLPPLYGDLQRLVQAFNNLISNAIKFTPDGGKINVSGQIYEKDEDGNPVSLQVTVRDSGIGIDEEDQELIFDKFFRVGEVKYHSSGATKFKGAGPGLGLAIAKGIIEGHGGRIWVESEGYDEEKMPGSAFHVVLAIRPPAMEARARMVRLKEEAEAAKLETIARKRPDELIKLRDEKEQES